MGKKSQKDMIVEMVLTYLGPDLKEGQSARDLLAPEEIELLAREIEGDIRSGRIPAGQKIKSDRVGNNNHYSLGNYSKNILYNWLRKDPRLSGKSSKLRTLDKAISQSKNKDDSTEVQLDALNRLYQSDFFDNEGQEMIIQAVYDLLYEIGLRTLKQKNPVLYKAWVEKLHKQKKSAS